MNKRAAIPTERSGQKELPYRPLPPIQTLFRVEAPPPIAPEQLTDQQVENWRRHLFHIVGPIAFLMRREEIQKVRDSIQAKFPPLAERIGNRP